jgi:hypothetical protein
MATVTSGTRGATTDDRAGPGVGPRRGHENGFRVNGPADGPTLHEKKHFSNHRTLGLCQKSSIDIERIQRNARPRNVAAAILRKSRNVAENAACHAATVLLPESCIHLSSSLKSLKCLARLVLLALLIQEHRQERK